MKYILSVCLILLTATLAPANNESPQATASAEEKGFSGKVVETMNAASYTYLLVDTGTKQLWAAAPAFAVKTGDTVSIGEAMPMRNYHSKTLNRDFDLVYFTGGIQVNGAKPAAAAVMGNLPKNHPPIGSGSINAMPENHPPIGAAAGEKGQKITGIKKPAGGKTVAEVYEGKAKLSGREVKIRGKVVKYNDGIMGRNWIHIQDGSGKVGSNDLLVTSSMEAKVGETILVTGVVAVNRDFGANYKYPVMLENAKIVVE